MAFKCGFYNAIEHDRVYSSEDFGQMFDGLITDGIYPSIGHCFAVVAGSGLGVRVRSGRAWFNNTWSYNSTDFAITLTPSDLLLPRIDTIILEIDQRLPVRMNAIKAITGSPAITPKKPTLSNSNGLYQYPLAFVRVEANANSITNGDIENAIGNVTPFTGIVLKSVSIEELWAQWDDQFHTWLDGLKVALSGDVATNLLGRIETLDVKKVAKDDLATQAQAEAGTLNNKWMSPLRVQQHFNYMAATDAQVQAASNVYRYVKPNQLPLMPASMILGIVGKSLTSVTLTSGTSWTVPTAARGKMLFVTMVGGGGGGGGGAAVSGAYSSSSSGQYSPGGGGGGGSAGECVIFLCMPTTTTISYSIGSGGAGGTGGVFTTGSGVASFNSVIGGDGGNGNATTFYGVTAAGGGGGQGATSTYLSNYYTSRFGAPGKLVRAPHGYSSSVIYLFGGGDERLLYFQQSSTDHYYTFYNVRQDGGPADIWSSVPGGGGGGSTNTSGGDIYDPDASVTTNLVGGVGGGGGGSAFAKGGDGGASSSTGKAGSLGSGGGGGGGGSNNGNGQVGGAGGAGRIVIQYQN